MPGAEAFLEAILDDPEADGPRLAFADWLEERDNHAPAEFIRVQIALARMAEDDPRRPALEAREEELQPAMRRGWLGQPHAVPGTLARWFQARRRAEFERGLLEGVSLAAERFLEHAEWLFRAWPIRRVELHTLAGHQLPRLSALPWWERVTRLQFGPAAFGDGAAVALVCSTNLPSLRELVLPSWVGPEQAAALARTDLRRLGRLSIVRGVLGPRGAAALAGWPSLSGVTRLELGKSGICSEGLEALCASGNLCRLTHLSLTGCNLTAAAPRALAACERFGGLEDLDLGDNLLLGDDGVACLADSPYLRRLRRLELGRTSCGAAGARALAGSAVVESLTELSLLWNRIGPEGAAALAHAPGLAGLQTLDLSGNEIGDEGARELAASPHLARLTVLSLRSNGLRSPRTWLRADAPGLASACELDLSRNSFGDEGAIVLAAWPGLARLRSLRLSHNKIGDAGVKALARSPHIVGLGRLDLSSNLFSRAGKAAFESAGLSGVVVRW